MTDQQDPQVTDEELEAAGAAEKDEVVVPDHVVEGGRDYRVEGNDVSGYLGVDVEYQTYANETEKPILTDTEKWDYTDQLDHLEGNMDEEKEETAVVEDDDENKSPETKVDGENTTPVSHNPPVGVPGAVITPTV